VSLEQPWQDGTVATEKSAKLGKRFERKEARQERGSESAIPQRRLLTDSTS
jgi:hypothetical protein